MGKPRLLILIRHAQSEGNKNREIHQMIPDHRVKLTDEGWKQAEDAGRRLRALLKPDDTLQFYTSPYRRTRETTEGILRTLSSADADSGAPSPFSRNSIKVYEEPRIREQDFGNFQPCSAEMERMWQERADYGHFFYRIPNGESAADAYDRISGFNESLWRQFGEKSFPSVCVLVSHGLMTRVFLMKWYHWSVEYFEDLRNVNHCEFVLMQQNLENGKFVLQNQLRTWSDLKRQRAEEATKQSNAAATEKQSDIPKRQNTLSHFMNNRPRHISSAAQGSRPSSADHAKWGGCVGGCDHHHERYPRRNEVQKGKTAVEQTTTTPPVSSTNKPEITATSAPRMNGEKTDTLPARRPPVSPDVLRLGRDAGGSESGAPTPTTETMSDDEYFPQAGLKPGSEKDGVKGMALANALKRAPSRRATEEDLERWANESGMGVGRRADALGDDPHEGSDEDWRDDTQGEVEYEGSTNDTRDAYQKQAARQLQKEKEHDQSIQGSVY